MDGPDDGLPVALADVVAATGVSFFKIKLMGDPDADLARLGAIAAVLDQGPAFKASLDADEQYGEDSFRHFLDGFRADRRFERLSENLLFIEQPFAREKARFLDAHPDIYRATPRGPALRVDQGAVAITSLDRQGFGSDVLPDLSTCQTIVAEGVYDR